MEAQRADEAASILFQARKTGKKIPELPANLKPQSIDDVRAIQDAMDRRFPEPVVGYKFHKKPNAPLCYAPLYPSKIFQSGAKIRAELALTLCIEAEITFRALRDLPPREADYSDDEAMDAFEACAAYEIVESQFSDLKKMATSAPLEVYADHMANGGFVLGEFRRDWRKVDFSKTHVKMYQNGKALADQIGGHPNTQPGSPLPLFANYMRTRTGIRVGAVIATGSFTSFRPMVANELVTCEFVGFGTCEVTIVT
jgi:2-keto-4-pentenoate hydratase